MTPRLTLLHLRWSDHLMSNDLTQYEDPIHFSTSKPEPKWKSEAQFAMESSCFCVICGSPFDLEGEVYNLDTGAERYKWMRNYRLIGSRRDVHYHNLAGLSEEDFHSACYNTSNCNDVFLSARATWNEGNDQLFHIDGLYPDTNIPYILKFNAMQQLGDHDTVFPLHEDCLQISRRAIKHLIPTTLGSRPSASCLSILNSILQSRFRDNARSAKPSDLVARNDLFDLCTATDLNGPRSVVGLSLLEWWASDYEKFYTDPTNVPNISTCVLHLLHDTRAVDACPSPRPLPTQELSALERLPTELLDHTIAYVSAYEAFSLHCASKTLARKLPLDNNSWRENILSGNGLPYLWDLDIEWLNKQHQKHSAKSKGADAAWSWKAVGQLLATKHFPLKSPNPRIDDLPNGLWNRRRIWSIIEQATRRDFSKVSNKEPTKSVLELRKRREPVFDWQLEEIMDDLGHYS